MFVHIQYTLCSVFPSLFENRRNNTIFINTFIHFSLTYCIWKQQQLHNKTPLFHRTRQTINSIENIFYEQNTTTKHTSVIKFTERTSRTNERNQDLFSLSPKSVFLFFPDWLFLHSIGALHEASLAQSKQKINTNYIALTD